ncbi:MAG: twin-arginine translocase TatA/TatE family subunit [Gemmatimonadota bacterium]
MFGNLGVWEILMILVVVMLLFGAKRLPEMGSSIGKGIREFKRSISDTHDAVMKPEDEHLSSGRQMDAPPTAPPSGGEPKRLSQ